jgi:hypothetical protein
MTKKSILLILLAATAVFILYFAHSVSNKDTRSITDTHMGYNIKIPADWNVFIANPEEVQRRLAEHSATPNASPESLYGFNEPKYTTDTVVRSANTAFQKGTSTIYLRGAHKTPFIYIEKYSDAKTMSEFDTYIKRDFVEAKSNSNNGQKPTLIKSKMDEKKSLWIVRMDYSVYADNTIYYGYIKYGDSVLDIKGHNLTSSEFEDIISSIVLN